MTTNPLPTSAVGLAAIADRLVSAWVEYSTGRAGNDREMKDALHAAIAGLKAADAALAPFAEVADNDIGELEANIDRFRPMSERYARAPLLTVGDLRRARRARGGEG